MKFVVSLDELNSKLQKTLPAVPQKSTLPILEHLNFKLENNRLMIIGTNQDITIMTSIDVESEDTGSVLIPAKRFEAFVKSLGNKGDLEVEVNHENFELNLKTNRGSFKMKGLNPEDYLDLPELFDSKRPGESYVNTDGTIDVSIPGIKIKKDDLIRLSEKTVFAVSNDEFRPAMTGVLFRFIDEFLISVSTDGYRLVKSVARLDENPYTDEGLDIIIPSKTVDLLKKVDSDVVFSTIDGDTVVSKIRFDIGDDTVLISKVIKEKFPPFESVLPENNEFKAEIDITELSSAIKRVALFSNNVSKQVRVNLYNNNISIKAADEETGNSGVESFTCDYEGEETEIGFNFKYIEEALMNIDSKDTQDNIVVMTFSEPARPVLLFPKSDEMDLVMLIMPVRI